jgi:hypothetical protein
MIIGIQGLIGGGKTLTMTFFLYQEGMVYGRNVFANYKLFFPFKWLKAKEMVDLNKNLVNSAIGVDELEVIADSRRSGSPQNVAMSYFVLQSRHRSVNFYYTTQFLHQVDKRIRDNTDVKVIVENLEYEGKPNQFRVIMIDHHKVKRKIKVFTLNGFTLYDLYDTNYIIDPFTYEKRKKK